MADVHLIVAHPTSDAVLLVDGALPVVPALDVLRAGELIGLPLFVVRTQHRDGEDRVAACAALASTPLPSGAAWSDERLARNVPRYAEGVAQWFDEEAGRVHVERAPWLRSDWLAETLAWTDDVLSTLGRRRRSVPIQLRHWGLSGVLRVPAEGGDVVVKETLPLFAAEPAIIRQLDELDPGIVPHVLAVDAERHRWLMDAFDATDRDVDPEALLALADLQRSVTSQAVKLRSAGCADRPLSSLPAEVAGLVSRDDVLFATGWNLQSTDGRVPERTFTFADRDDLAAALPEIERRTDRLASYGVPETIVHGDFHIHNVAWTGRRFVLFDWAHAAIGHPFMDLPMWMQWSHDPDGSAIAYARTWSLPDPADAWRDAHPVALLHHAMTLLPLIDAGGDAAAEWAAGVQKRLLQALDLLRP